jgi:hypothetical protein
VAFVRSCWKTILMVLPTIGMCAFGIIIGDDVPDVRAYLLADGIQHRRHNPPRNPVSLPPPLGNPSPLDSNKSTIHNRILYNMRIAPSLPS